MAGSGGWAEIIPEGEPPEIDVTVAHPARIYDYWLGGKNNFAADREAAEATLAVNPYILPGVRANRAFLASAVGFLAGEAGIRQFLDVGTGLPTENNTHEAAHSVAPDARVVYVDNDPIVIAHARALLTGRSGMTDYVYADLRQPETILREAARTLDFGQPVAIVLLMILMHISDEDRPHELVARLLDAVPSGSYLVISETANDVDAEVIQASQEQYNKRVTDTQWASRTSDTFARYFSGLEIVEPGLVTMGLWRPAPGVPIPPYPIPAYCGVARKPLGCDHHSFGIMDFDFPNGYRFHLTGGAPAPMIDPMWPRGPIPWWRAAGVPAAVPVGPAMTTLRSVIAYLATMIRCAGIVYIVVEVVIWHSFYTAAAWHLVAPVLAVAWGAAAIVYLRRYLPSPVTACADSAVYVALALGAQASVPPAARDSAFSWLVITMSGQLIVPAWYWYAPGALPVLLALASPLAFWAGAMLQPVTDARTLAGAAFMLLVIGLVHGGGRWLLYGRAAAADADLDRADQAAREQYAVLCRNIERREHERLLHDTVLNTLTSVARSGGDAVAEVVARCRQDVALMEAALSADDLAPAPVTPAGDLRGEVRAVVADMRDRGLTVHVEADDAAGAAVPAPVVWAISNAAREALSNVAAHAGTGEAWVTVRSMALEGDAGAPCRLLVVIRDRGTGFDPARVDQARLGLRRSIGERTAECGGEVSIRSAPGQGTEVSLSWPAAGPGDAGHRADHALAHDGPPW